jgi:hypothetical protein
MNQIQPKRNQFKQEDTNNDVIKLLASIALGVGQGK